MTAPLSVLDPARIDELVRAGLIAPDEVLAGSMQLRDMSRRNANVLVQRRDGGSYHVKWAVTEGSREALAHEAMVHRLLAETAAAPLVPVLHEHRADAGMLVVEGIDDARDLRAVHVGEGDFPSHAAAAVGTTTGQLHRAMRASGVRAGREEVPWALMLHRALVDDLRALTPDSVDLIRALQQHPATGAALDALAASWEPHHLVHGDLKWDNVLVLADRGDPPVRVVDWEHARDGEPLWDVGSLVAGYLSFWIYSIDAREGVEPTELAGLARSPLRTMAAAVATLWAAYRDETGALQADASRAAAMAGARLLANAYEATQAGARFNAHLVLHLQLGVNLVQKPLLHMASIGLGTP